MKAVGIDPSPAQPAKARERRPGVDGMELHRGDAVTCLGETSTVIDAAFSVFGAAWFTEPVLPAPRT